MLSINGKFLSQEVTGVQRVAIEMASRLSANIVENKHTGLAGHLYEQFIIPFKKKGVLLSFCNTAPLVLKNQVVYIHDVAVLENPQWFSKGFYFYYRLMLPLLAKRAKVIITVSEYSKKRICTSLRISKDKVFVISNGVSDNFTDSESLSDIEDILSEIGGRFILTVGSMDPRKNLSKLIKAFSVSSLAVNGYKLVVVGGENSSFSKFMLDNSNENVLFMGRVSDSKLSALYSRCSGFAYMSRYEGFGLPVLEAMKAGVPVLCSNTTALKEIADLGFCMSCDPESLDGISKSLELFLDYPSEYLIKARNYADSCNWDSAVAKLMRIVEREFA